MHSYYSIPDHDLIAAVEGWNVHNLPNWELINRSSDRIVGTQKVSSKQPNNYTGKGDGFPKNYFRCHWPHFNLRKGCFQPVINLNERYISISQKSPFVKLFTQKKNLFQSSFFFGILSSSAWLGIQGLYYSLLFFNKVINNRKSIGIKNPGFPVEPGMTGRSVWFVILCLSGTNYKGFIRLHSALLYFA